MPTQNPLRGASSALQRLPGQLRPATATYTTPPSSPIAATASPAPRVFHSTSTPIAPSCLSLPRHIPNPAQTAKMSSTTMKATHGHNEACCNIPPVISSGYAKKGAYVDDVAGRKAYVTGPADATKGIIVVFDIFGYFDQTLQGADILATSDEHARYRVFVPDFVQGDACPIEWYPPETEEKQKKLGDWFGRHSPQEVAELLPGYVKALQEKNPAIKSWGVVGFCWGGKVVSLVTSGAANPFSIGAEAHPAMVDPAEAAAIKVPLILLASKEEPADKVKEFESKLAVPKHVEVFADQIHGWMAARADLSDPRVKEEYARGYKTVLEFFGKHWK